MSKTTTYEVIECAMYWPGETGPQGSVNHYRIEILLPDGPEITADWCAGILTFSAPTIDAVLEKVVTVMGKLGYKGTLYISDETWRINYVVIDYSRDKPLMRCNARNIEWANQHMPTSKA